MRDLAEFAGFFAAHAIWCVSDDGPLVPIYAYELASGQRGMDRLVVEDSAEAQLVGREYLRENRRGATRAALLYDAFVNAGSERRDAIVVEAEDYGSGVTFTIVVPYRSSDSPKGFGVFPAELLGHAGLSIQRTGEVLAPFLTGVDSHEKGAEVWNSHVLARE